MQVEINGSIYLDELNFDDVQALVINLNNPSVTDNLLYLPNPYTETDARDWIQLSLERKVKSLLPLRFAIREKNGQLIGGIGMKPENEDISRHRAEIGYYVAPAHWGKGIATLAIKAFSDWVFNSYGLTKLTAMTFSENIASEKVLLNSGYKQEGFCERHINKNNRLLDVKLFALINKDHG